VQSRRIKRLFVLMPLVRTDRIARHDVVSHASSIVQQRV